MINFNYSLDKINYSWQNAFFWGNFVGHCKKAREGSLGNRVIHVLIAAIEFLPIISQISSICEKLIIENFSIAVFSLNAQFLTNKLISIENYKKKHRLIPNPNNLTDGANRSSEKSKINNTEPILEIPKLENTNKREMSKSATISPVSKVCKGIYTAEGKTEKAENIYFGMELIDDNSREIWSDYSKAADNLCIFLRMMVRFLDDENELKNLQQHSGLSEEEFKNLSTQFRKRGLHPQGKLAGAILDIPGGIVGFMIEPNLSGVFAPATYVAYISKKPITGPLSFPKTESNFKIFREKYKDLLMSVGVRLDNRPLFENRGIFRNPCSVIEGGYSNIATQLHAFTGKVMKECVNQTLGGKEKLYMSVSPLPNMKELLVKKIGLERIKTKDSIPKELRIQSSGLFEEQFLIGLEDLANLH